MKKQNFLWNLLNVNKWKSSPILWGVFFIGILYCNIIFLNGNIMSDGGPTMSGNDPWGASIYINKIKMLHNIVKSGNLPLWDPSESTGRPVFGDPNFKVSSPIQWIMAIYPTLRIINFLTLLKLLFSFIMMFYFLEKMKLSFLATLVGSVFWVTNGYTTGYINHNHFDVYMLTPFIFYSILALHQELNPKNFFFLFIALYLVLSSGNPQELLSIAFIAIPFFISLNISKFSHSYILYTIACCLCAFLIYSPEFFVTWNFHLNWDSFHSSTIWTGPSNGKDIFLKLLFPRIDPALLPSRTGENMSGFSFLGIGIIFLTFFHLVKEKKIWSFIFCMILLLIVFFEDFFLKEIFFRKIISTIPIINEINYNKYLVCLYFILSISASFGLDKALKSPWKTSALIGPILLFCLLFKVDNTFLRREDTLLYFSYLIFLMAILFVKMPIKIKHAAIFLILLIELRESYNYRNKFFSSRTIDEVYSVSYQIDSVPASENELTKQLIQSSNPFRIFVPDNSLSSVTQNIDLVHQIQGGEATQIKWYREFFKTFFHVDLIPPATLIDFKEFENYSLNPMLKKLNVKYLVFDILSHFKAPQESDYQFDKEIKQVRYLELFKVKKEEELTPRAFFVNKVKGVSDYHEAISIIKNDINQFDKVALIDKEYLRDIPENLLNGSIQNSEVKILEYHNNNVKIWTNTNTPSFLVLTDVYFPSWQAKIESFENNSFISHKTKIYLSNGAFRGIVVPEGKHVITFEYVPYAIFYTRILALLGAFALFFIMRYGFLKRKKSISYEVAQDFVPVFS